MLLCADAIFCLGLSQVTRPSLGFYSVVSLSHRPWPHLGHWSASPHVLHPPCPDLRTPGPVPQLQKNPRKPLLVTSAVSSSAINTLKLKLWSEPQRDTLWDAHALRPGIPSKCSRISINLQPPQTWYAKGVES